MTKKHEVIEEETRPLDTAKELAVVSPPLEIYENEHSFEVLVSLPGSEASETQVELNEGILKLSAIRRLPEREVWDRLHGEFGSCRFAKEIQVPRMVNKEGIEVSYENGILKILLPKAEPEKREIPIRVH